MTRKEVLDELQASFNNNEALIKSAPKATAVQSYLVEENSRILKKMRFVKSLMGNGLIR
jgi:hypothetical protein